MKNNVKTIGISLAFIAVVSGLLLVFKKQKTTTAVIGEEPKKDNLQTTSANATALDKNKVLKKGITGKEVAELQRLLGGLSTDGIFGNLTEAKLFQKLSIDKITLNQYQDFVNKYIFISAINSDGKKRDYNVMYSFDIDFLKSWASASKKSESTFLYGISKYSTQTGKQDNSYGLNLAHMFST